MYAQLSMVEEDLRIRLRPDYTKSTSQVYMDAVLEYLKLDSGICILDQCGERFRDENLPSWVPNLAVPRSTQYLGTGYHQASGISKSDLFYDNGSSLLAKGVLSATVVEVSEQVNLVPSFDDIVSVWKSWSRPTWYERVYSTGESFIDAYCSTLVCGSLTERFPEVGLYSNLEMAQIMLGKANDPNLKQCRKQRIEEYTQGYAWHPGNFKKVISRFDKYEWDAVCYTGGRRFFTTVEGYVGLCPADTRPGDNICILLGMGDPILLRSADHDRFQVVGICYVHGLMDGEGLLGRLPEGWHIEYHYTSHSQEEVDPMAPFYCQEGTGTSTQEDPRLWELPPGWISSYSEDGVLEFIAEGKASPTWIDPRLSPASLEEHGVELRTFCLV